MRKGRVEGKRSRPSLSMTCDRFLLCNSLQLAATRQPLRFPSLLLPSFFPSFHLILLRLPLSLLFLLIFVARRRIHHVCTAMQSRCDVLGAFCRRSIDSADSIEGPEKGPAGPDKDDAAADSGGRRCFTRMPNMPSQDACYVEDLFLFANSHGANDFRYREIEK